MPPSVLTGARHVRPVSGNLLYPEAGTSITCWQARACSTVLPLNRRSGERTDENVTCPHFGDGHGRGSVAAKERDHGQHAPVAFSSLRDAQLREDAADVLLDRPLGQPQPLGYAGVGQTLGHQREHFTLPW